MSHDSSAWGPLDFSGTEVAPGESVDVKLKAGESYTADPISLAVTIIRGSRPGPALFLTASIHGDELNGVAIIRDLLADHEMTTLAGTLIAVPVANVPGFLALERRAPDRRDLNRSFPGSALGSPTSRLAHQLSREVVVRSDFGIDLHTSGGERTNFPQVRADLDHPEVARLARAFGTSLIVHGTGPDRSLRKTAVRKNVPTIVYEAGSPRRFERRFIDTGVRGVLNVLRHLGMLEGSPLEPALRIEVRRTRWLRARLGGILDLRVRLGEPLERGQLISVNTNPFGRERSQLRSRQAGIVIGLTRLPLVHPGDAVCHLAEVEKHQREAWRELWASS